MHFDDLRCGVIDADLKLQTKDPVEDRWFTSRVLAYDGSIPIIVSLRYGIYNFEAIQVIDKVYEYFFLNYFKILRVREIIKLIELLSVSFPHSLELSIMGLFLLGELVAQLIVLGSQIIKGCYCVGVLLIDITSSASFYYLFYIILFKKQYFSEKYFFSFRTINNSITDNSYNKYRTANGRNWNNYQG